jgi:hypothetical protein
VRTCVGRNVVHTLEDAGGVCHLLSLLEGFEVVTANPALRVNDAVADFHNLNAGWGVTVLLCFEEVHSSLSFSCPTALLLLVV